MSKFIEVSKKVASATEHLPYSAYKSACAIALTHEGEIAKTDKGFFQATFKSNKVATKFAEEYNAAYTAAHDAYVPKSEREPAPAPKSAPAKKDKTPKGKGNSKLTGNDYVKANPSCTREEAAAHGLKGITKQQLKALKVELGVR